MPHDRKRYLEPLLEKVATFSPLVGIMGHRQVGKTNLLGHTCKNYYSLDTAKERADAEHDPKNFLHQRAGSMVALDECQSVPKLFPELKEWVRLHKKPGQFILSGSVRFTSREAIKESLTGRIINLELLPFTISELNHEPLSDIATSILKTESVSSRLIDFKMSNSFFNKKREQVNLYLDRGGLPGVCFIRDEKLRKLKIEEQLNTMLDRDLRLVRKTNLALTDIKNLLTALANKQGQPIDYSQLKKDTQISTPTIKHLLFALEALFIIRSMRIEGSLKGHAIFFEDLAEWNYFRTSKPSALEQLTHLSFTQLRAQFHYKIGESTETFQYRTRSGVVVPIAFKNKLGALGIIPIENSLTLNKSIAAAHSFLKTYSKSNVIIVYLENTPPRLISDRIIAGSICAVI